MNVYEILGVFEYRFFYNIVYKILKNKKTKNKTLKDLISLYFCEYSDRKSKNIVKYKNDIKYEWAKTPNNLKKIYKETCLIAYLKCKDFYFFVFDNGECLNSKDSLPVKIILFSFDKKIFETIKIFKKEIKKIGKISLSNASNIKEYIITRSKNPQDFDIYGENYFFSIVKNNLNNNINISYWLLSIIFFIIAIVLIIIINNGSKNLVFNKINLFLDNTSDSNKNSIFTNVLSDIFSAFLFFIVGNVINIIVFHIIYKDTYHYETEDIIINYNDNIRKIYINNELETKVNNDRGYSR